MEVVFFKISFLIWFYKKEHLILFIKMVLEVMLIIIFLHSIMSHDQIIFDNAYNVSPNYNDFFKLL